MFILLVARMLHKDGVYQDVMYGTRWSYIEKMLSCAFDSVYIIFRNIVLRLLYFITF